MPCSCDCKGMWDRIVSIGQTLNENLSLSTLEPLMELIIEHCIRKCNHSIGNEMVRWTKLVDAILLSASAFLFSPLGTCLIENSLKVLVRALTFSKYLIMPGSFAMPAIKASYSASLLVASNLNLKAYVNSTPSGFIIIRPAPEPSMHDHPSLKSIHGSESSSLSSMGVSGGSKLHLSSLPATFELDSICFIGWTALMASFAAARVLKNGYDFLANLDKNMLRLARFPFSLCTSFKHFGGGKLRTASTLSGHTFNPLAFTLYPRNVPSLIPKRPPGFPLLRRLPYFSQSYPLASRRIYQGCALVDRTAPSALLLLK
ncbi:hypothetical protein Tco_0008504 [Tanacetum coccineum]